MEIKLIVIFLLLSFTSQRVSGSGRFITTLLSYTQYQPLTSLGEVCDSARSLPCDRFYLIQISPEAQTVIRLETPRITETNFERLPSFLVKMDRMTSVSYEIAIFDRDDGNPAPLRTQSSSLGVVAVNGFDLDSTSSPTILSVNTSESFHGITFRIEVECDKNFYGPRCDKVCEPTDGDNGHFMCGEDGEMVCRSGFRDESQNCMVSVSPCENSPCLNGGICSVTAANTAQCRCSPGFTGDFCSRRTSPCDCNPCSNGGACVLANTPLGFACQCTTGWTGELCLEDFNECTIGSSCPFGVSCINTPGSYTCCIGLAGPTPPPLGNTRAAITAAPQPTTTAPQPTTTPRPAATRPQTTRTTTTTTTQAPTPPQQRFISQQTVQPPIPVTERATAPRNVVTQPTTPRRFAIQQTQPPEPINTPQQAIFVKQTTEAPRPVTQPPTAAVVPDPVQNAATEHCGNPTPQLRTVLIKNLQVTLQQNLYQSKTINLQRVSTNPTAFARFIRTRCNMLIVGRVFANPNGTQQIQCMLTEINNCLFGSSSIPVPASSAIGPVVNPAAPIPSTDRRTG